MFNDFLLNHGSNPLFDLPIVSLISTRAVIHSSRWLKFAPFPRSRLLRLMFRGEWFTFDMKCPSLAHFEHFSRFSELFEELTEAASLDEDDNCFTRYEGSYIDQGRV